MHIDPYIVLGSAIVGLLVGMTGAGGGALMTPMLILLFGVTPSAAIASDLVAAVVMRPVGAAVHLRAERSTSRLVRWMVLGSVPAAFLGTYLLHLMGDSSRPRTTSRRRSAWRCWSARRRCSCATCSTGAPGQRRAGKIAELTPRPLVTVAIGILGGLIVGLTSVGSGSLMIVLLLFAYPVIGANQLVGTDLTQAVPLTAAAAMGALIFGHVEFGVTTSLILGSVPAVLVGSMLSSRAPDRYIRPVIAFVIFASGLKYAGLGTVRARLDDARDRDRERGRGRASALPFATRRDQQRARGRRAQRLTGYSVAAKPDDRPRCQAPRSMRPVRRRAEAWR